MAKRSRRALPAASTPTDGAVGPRQPCPCGSGRRYKACHGASSGDVPFVVRAFEGLPSECDWVAMRELVPAGSASLTLRPGAYDGMVDSSSDGVPVLLVSVLPGLAPAMRRDDGAAWLAAQVTHSSGDPSTDLARALGGALAAEPGSSVAVTDLPTGGPRLQDVLDLDAPLTVTVHDGYDFWFEGQDDADGTRAAALEQLNEAVQPTTRLTSVEAAYWTSTGTREHLRWVLPHDEEALLTALARLHAAGADSLVEGSRLVGSFRSHGLLVPVWDLPLGTGADAVEEPAKAFGERLVEVLDDRRALTDAERSARHGLANRQLTIR